MFWIVTLIVASLIGLASGWLTFQTTHERVIICFETARAGAAVERLKQAVARMLSRGRWPFQDSRHS